MVRECASRTYNHDGTLQMSNSCDISRVAACVDEFPGHGRPMSVDIVAL